MKNLDKVLNDEANFLPKPVQLIQLFRSFLLENKINSSNDLYSSEMLYEKLPELLERAVKITGFPRDFK